MKKLYIQYGLFGNIWELDIEHPWTIEKIIDVYTVSQHRFLKLVEGGLQFLLYQIESKKEENDEECYVVKAGYSVWEEGFEPDYEIPGIDEKFNGKREKEKDGLFFYYIEEKDKDESNAIKNALGKIEKYRTERYIMSDKKWDDEDKKEYIKTCERNWDWKKTNGKPVDKYLNDKKEREKAFRDLASDF